MPARPPVLSSQIYLTPLSAASAIGVLLAGRREVVGYQERAFALGDYGSANHWGFHEQRRLRYAVLWGHYEGSVYRSIHAFAEEMKSKFDLYNYIRPVDSPAYRDVEFWATHLMGGLLDCEAGDGILKRSALPIITENDQLRPAIATLWRDSNWQSKKETWTRFGAAMGDAPLMIVDDPYRQKVYLKPFHPGTLRYYERDDYGNCKGYVIEEIRRHPAASPIASEHWTAVYAELCEKVGEQIVYTTYLDGVEYDWRQYPDGTPTERMVGPTWTENYGFVPMILAQHRDMGLGWGMAELHASLPKLHELDDVASKVDDAIRKAIDPRWMITGVAPADGLDFGTGEGDENSDGESDTARDSLDAIYATDPAAKAQALITNIDIAASCARIDSILARIEREHPELSADLAGAAASGKARRVAQERVEALVAQRRAGYDDALVRAQQMAVSIGAIKGYPIGVGFTENSYLNGDLDHEIGDRPVFAVDELDRLEESKARADVFKVLVDGGMPLVDAAEEAGYSPERIKAMAAAQAINEAKAAADAKAKTDALMTKTTTVAMNGNLTNGAAPPTAGTPELPVPNGVAV